MKEARLLSRDLQSVVPDEEKEEEEEECCYSFDWYSVGGVGVEMSSIITVEWRI